MSKAELEQGVSQLAQRVFELEIFCGQLLRTPKPEAKKETTKRKTSGR